MNKKYFEYPFVLLTRGIGEGDQPDPEVGSAQNTIDACSFAAWQQFGVDMDGDGDIDFDDYRRWYSQHFGNTGWGDYNPGISITPGDPFPSNP